MKAPGTVFFLVGAQRSGTTMLRLMLDHHPRICCAGEYNFVVKHLDPGGAEPDAKTLRARLEEDRPFRYSDLCLAERGVGADGGPDTGDGSYGALVRDLLDQPRRASGKPVVGATVHERPAELLRWWPRARFIHLVRDPRDVAPSVIGMGWAGNAYYGTRHWAEAVDGVEELRSTAPEGCVLDVRFEELVSKPEEELARICAFLGVDPDPAMLRYAEDTSYPPPDPSAAWRWRGRGDDGAVQQVEAAAGARLERYGYDLAGLAEKPVRGLRALMLRVQDRWGRLRFRLKRYGLRTVLVHALARRLGLHGLERRTRRRMQRVDQENLR